MLYFLSICLLLYLLVHLCISDGLIRRVYLWEHKHADAALSSFYLYPRSAQGEFIVPRTKFNVLPWLSYTWLGNLFIDLIWTSLLVEPVMTPVTRWVRSLYITSLYWTLFFSPPGFLMKVNPKEENIMNIMSLEIKARFLLRKKWQHCSHSNHTIVCLKAFGTCKYQCN